MHVPNLPIHHTFRYIYLACMWLTVQGKCPIKYSPGAIQMISQLLLKDKKYFLSWCALKLQRHHNGHDGAPNHQPYDCLLNCLFRWGADIEKTSKLRVTGLCEGNSPVTGEFPAQRTSNTENVSIWWHHHEFCWCEVSEAHPRQCQTFFAIS